MQVLHGIISLSIMWSLYMKLSSWVMVQFAHTRLIMAVMVITVIVITNDGDYILMLLWSSAK